MGVITFNGIPSTSAGIVVERPPDYTAPQKDYEVIHVPGRSGDIILDNGSYQNVERNYDIAIGDRNIDFHHLANDISNWLYSANGYALLYDTYEPDYYRIAYYRDETSVTNILSHAGRATVSFNCKPQRYLRSGFNPINLTKNGSTILNNPTKQSSYPILAISLTGANDVALNINGYGIIISKNAVSGGLSETIFIDSETQEIYRKTGMVLTEISRSYSANNIIPNSPSHDSIYFRVSNPLSVEEMLKSKVRFYQAGEISSDALFEDRSKKYHVISINNGDGTQNIQIADTGDGGEKYHIISVDKGDGMQKIQITDATDAEERIFTDYTETFVNIIKLVKTSDGYTRSGLYVKTSIEEPYLDIYRDVTIGEDLTLHKSGSAINMSQYVSLTNGFPLLKSGINLCTSGSGIGSDFYVVPRWYTI